MDTRTQAGGDAVSWRRWIYLTIEAGGSSAAAHYFDDFMVVLILANVLAVILESVPSIHAQFATAFLVFDIVSVAIFAAEYSLRLWASIEIPAIRQRGPVLGRLMFASRPSQIIDFLAFAPTFLSLIMPAADLRVLRMFRLLRFLKLVRYSPAMVTLGRALYEERRALIGAMFLMIGTAVFSGTIMHVIEAEAQPKQFGTIPDAMWWSLATLTTIGYGDAVPITPLGKMFGAIVMICGLGLFALPIGIVATAFVNEIHRRDFVVTWGMVARVPLFATLDAAAIAEVMKIMRTRAVSAGTVIAARGEEAEGMFFIADGEVKIQLPRGHIKLGAGEFFGELALLKRVKRMGTVTALVRTNMMIIDALDFENLLDRDEVLKARILEIADERLAGEWADVSSDVVASEFDQRPSTRPVGDPLL
ncbi:MAG: cyclic nucleotide-binding domain-containing protein [Alphaproteobacteria bacterium]|nr:cyclic nucleotide-binding domain-containing protein [Alphaproteobacteria bacterium]